MRVGVISAVASLSLLVSACRGQPPAPDLGVDTEVAVRGELIFRDRCVACHSLGHGGRRRAPDLLNVTTRRAEGWLRRWLAGPADLATDDPDAQQLVQAWTVVMPDPKLDDAAITDVIVFLGHQSALGPLAHTPPAALSEKELEATRVTYVDRCAGCHGATRQGATGPELSAPRSVELGTDALAATLRYGRPWGMPAWGKLGILTETQLSQLAAYLQLPVPP